MDINKILFEQLNLQGVQTPFTADEVNGSDAVQKETTKENTEIKQQLSSALNAEDEDSSLQIDNKEIKTSGQNINSLYSNIANTNNLINVLSNQAQVYNNEIKKTEEEIAQKAKEYEDLAQEIEEKQAEYDALVSEAENSNDESITERVNALGEEINSMVGDLDNIKTSINNLQTTLSSKQSLANTFNTSINNLSKVQSKISKEAITTQSATTADKVDNNSSDKSADKNNAAKTKNWTVPDRVKQEFEWLKGEPHHSFHSLNEIIGGHCQGTAWESNAFYDAYKTKSFKELNSIPDEVDIDGDGQVSADEKYYMKNYKLVAYSALVGLPTNRNSLERNTIEEQIERLEFLENNPEIAEITQALVDVCKNTPGMLNEIYARQSVHKKYDFSVDIDVRISGVNQTLNQFDMQRYWKDADYQKQTESFTGDAKRDYQSNIQAQVDRNNPLNIYKNYLQETELSQEEYQNIINKINNCDNKNIKAKLAEVLSIAQDKIAK